MKTAIYVNQKILEFRKYLSGENKNKYINLFKKYIPSDLSNKFIFIGELSNIDAYCEIIELNPNNKYFIFDSASTINLLTEYLNIKFPEIDICYYEKEKYFTSFNNDLDRPLEEFFYSNNNKFDLIILHPLYKSSIKKEVLDFNKNVLKSLNDNDSKFITLMPINWMQSPWNFIDTKNFYKKSKELYHNFGIDILKNLNSVEIIPFYDAIKLLCDNKMTGDVGLCVFTKAGGFNYKSLIKQIAVKIYNKLPSVLTKFDTDKVDGVRVRILQLNTAPFDSFNQFFNFGKILWFKDGLKNNECWNNFYNKTVSISEYEKNKKQPIFNSIKFDSCIEAENFCRQFNTALCKVFTHYIKNKRKNYPEQILWLGDAIHPRTQEKGYKSEWTNEDLYLYFDLTNEEQKEIESIIEEFKQFAPNAPQYEIIDYNEITNIETNSNISNDDNYLKIKEDLTDKHVNKPVNKHVNNFNNNVINNKLAIYINIERNKIDCRLIMFPTTIIFSSEFSDINLLNEWINYWKDLKINIFCNNLESLSNNKKQLNIIEMSYTDILDKLRINDLNNFDELIKLKV